MADTLTFELVSPEQKLASTDAEAVTIPGMEGELTAMVNHAAFLTTLRPGFVTVQGGKAPARYFVTGGFAEITGDFVSVLAEKAIKADDLDAAWLDARIADAEQAHADAAYERKQITRQRIDDFQAVRAAL